jgi:hypothetical protein
MYPHPIQICNTVIIRLCNWISHIRVSSYSYSGVVDAVVIGWRDYYMHDYLLTA